MTSFLTQTAHIVTGQVSQTLVNAVLALALLHQNTDVWLFLRENMVEAA
jgi:hypothetical protein